MSKFHSEAKMPKSEEMKKIESKVKSGFTDLVEFFKTKPYIRLQKSIKKVDNEYWNSLSEGEKAIFVKKYVNPVKDKKINFFKETVKQILESIEKESRNFQSLKEVKNILSDIKDEGKTPPPSTQSMEFWDYSKISAFGVEYFNSKIKKIVQRHELVKSVSKNFYKFEQNDSKNSLSLRFNFSENTDIFHEAAEKLVFYLKLNKNILKDQKSETVFDLKKDSFLYKKESDKNSIIGK